MKITREDLKIFSNYFLGLSLFLLALSIIIFTREITTFRSELPQMLLSVEKTAERIEPAVQGLNDFRDLIPSILDEVQKSREMVPPILNEVAAVRETLPGILSEVSETRKAIPPVLKEIHKTREEIPNILETVDKTAIAIDNAANEANALRPMVPEIIAEIEATRKSVGPTLTRVDQLITKASSVGKDTTEGAISGVLTGVLKAPFSLFTGFGKSNADRKFTGTTEFSETDLNIAKNAFYEVISKPIGSTNNWSNPETEMSGTITVASSYQSAGNKCLKIKNHTTRAGKVVANILFGICRDENMAWKLDK